MLQGAGFDKNSISSITQDLDKMILTVNKINTSQLKNGDIKIKISGVDEVGRAVNVVRTFDKETGKVMNTTKSFVQSFSNTLNGISDIQTKSRTLSNNIETWMSQNKKAADAYGNTLKELLNQLSGNESPEALKSIGLRFAEIKSDAKKQIL